MSVHSPSDSRFRQILGEHCRLLQGRIDRLFAQLMIWQFCAGLCAALWVSPQTWSGPHAEVHLHVWAALLIGGGIVAYPIYLALRRPGLVWTRHAIAISQALMCALLIHLCAGRIETHFQVFGVLAFLSFYRDWRVLITATVVTTIDHFVRGVVWPQSVFGVASASPWRAMEHAAWVLFEVGFLIRSCVTGKRELKELVERQVNLEEARSSIEIEVRERTAELQRAHDQLEEAAEQRVVAEHEHELLGAQLVQAHKLESIGQLAAGIAHEINTPTQFVGDNTRFLKDSFEELSPVLKKAEALADSVQAGQSPAELAGELKASLDEADVEFLVAEIPKAISQSLGGIDRVRSIVQSMKDFSHPGVEGMSSLDLNRSIESTITVARNEWKYVADMETCFDEQLPLVSCLPGEINQVVLNMIVNAAHAIADVYAAKDVKAKGVITVSTKHEGDFAVIRIRDTGTGIPESARVKIFDPFFTTKEVGKGTGQGLSIARGVIVNRHAGSLDFETELGKGTTFTIRLPLVGPTAEKA